ncbi:alpha-xenorhabdolysin family binary toxin subunit A [Pseudomonas syringae]|uniref:Alpha-xenorhabdolysin family binary toxin subunit A n=2 Tax=Pseudomonas syringae TaxID=317 RepID=A0A9Q4A852_PSESX|nr:alpha-xenorhabdolysin family binary toxin subunit A [Pseudomonas syringae]MCF5470094.1 alpha-xenorhabdolysin family binary toxin subunit A [Pseudomonas syringae]MCF5474994.1 alpha-xenorhabdolysin family binary toxin subunit A [Pseudomonas syringae]MCF5485084.1 alpha-xenorhabdolysin family binary toxin subunit A [Pseudomonas syringae]MCF5488550.1 alpha-xenorhabdolysin family binary toxin subunit A [Pseudomonas syringae]MCF5494975.1 alpha-xenorhabdolysin family binary toxin subunit A [Pseudom
MSTQATLLENEDIARVTLKPVEYLSLMLDDEKKGGRGAALILTQEDILSLKRYERHALNIPTSLARVEQQLGFTKSGIPGLEPKDMLVTYLAIYSHGKSWLGIEEGIKRSGFTIDLFAAQFSDQGRQIINYIEKMDFAKQLDLTVADLTIEEARNTPPVPLSATDQRVCITLAQFLKKTASQIKNHQHAAGILAQHIDTFSTVLSVQLIPGINDKVKLASRSDLDQQIKELEKDIEQLTVDIEHKNKEYKAAKNNIAWGVFGGPIGVAITGGIFGSQAEKIRKEKNRMIASKNQKVQTLKEKVPLAAAVRSLQILFEDMNIRMLDAHQSATNLKDLWALLAAYIESSAHELSEIKDDQALLIFSLQFQGVVTPWLEIKGMTTQLLKLFESALDQFQREQQSSKTGQ